MTDKLHLTVKPDRYCISSNHNLIVRTTTIGKGENKITTSHLHENIKNICSVDTDGRGLLITMNPNKVINHTIGTQPMTFKAWQSSIFKVNDTLAELGVDVNLMESKIHRRDSDFDIKTSRPYQDYLPLWAFILPDTATRGRNRGYENSRYIENSKKLKIAIYDKATEQQLNVNITRLEPRYTDLSTDKTFSTLLLGDITEKQFLNIREKDKTLITKQVFSVEPKVIRAGLHSIMREFKMNNVSHSKAIKKIAFLALAKEAKELGIDTMEFYRTIEPDRLRRSRFLRELKDNFYVNSDLKNLFIEFKELFKKVA
jgi:hypothetical protein